MQSYSSFISQLFIVLIHLHFSQSYSSFISQRYSSFSSNFTSSQSYSSFISQLFILLIYLHFFTIILHSSLNYSFFYPPSYIYHLTLNSSLNYLSFSSTFTSSPSILHSSLNYSSFSSTFTSLPSILYSSLNYSCFSFTFTSSKSYSSFISQLFILLIHLHFFTILLFIHLSTIHPSHPSSLLYHPSFIHLSHLFILLPLTHLSIPIEFSFIFFKVSFTSS